VALVLAGCSFRREVVVDPTAAEARLAELASKVEALDERLATLERTLDERRSASARPPDEPSRPPAAEAGALESEARAAFEAINLVMAGGDAARAKNELDAFLEKYGATAVGRQAQRLRQELSVVGKPAPERWGIEKWFQGEHDIDLQSGKTTLVVFWEIWCPHCRREAPKVQALYESYRASGLQVLGLTKITKSATEEGVRAFIEVHKLAYRIA
jgi:thiol-disulfide isomerase/thioredoxin/outer membrane murein-binding lipoprotein Lpp